MLQSDAAGLRCGCDHHGRGGGHWRGRGWWSRARRGVYEETELLQPSSIRGLAARTSMRSRPGRRRRSGRRRPQQGESQAAVGSARMRELEVWASEIVRDVAEAVPEGVTVAGEKLQVAPAGRPEQAKVTG